MQASRNYLEQRNLNDNIADRDNIKIQEFCCKLVSAEHFILYNAASENQLAKYASLINVTVTACWQKGLYL